ncbi:putative transferase CAF17 homolog, mitochondrial [Leguminivora glycinivorella]|uniref:putative transferase CAF17 homolog, mitochondrial n=1 Tax=Leguminivora glycinivorella TaxID=1035111 RepID=UPI002010B47F|nr:putative transferase CAF17 homolog, mitochondrial [Leguminivora glycinivorella]
MIYQVNSIFRKPHALRHLIRYLHSEQPSSVLYPLPKRKILKVAGDDASRFLHGLITNDMEHLSGATSMYAMFLNNKGRVLFDTLIYKWQNQHSFMLECDENVLAQLKKHLKIYKLRSAVQIEDLSQDLRVWALLPSPDLIPDCKSFTENQINIYKDPRLADLGYRVVSTALLNGSQVAKQINENIEVESSEEGYQYLRYKLGVSEGCHDLPPGTCFPLEANCDYLHGVSFHKGCYIGQELTARVHHTGVVRKRIMPLKITNLGNDEIETNTIIRAEGKPTSNLGKFKSYIKDYGLGLVRIKEALDAKVLIVDKSTMEAFKPAWWPVEAPKEKATTLKTEE